MEIELIQLELRYEDLRRRNANRERRLVASLAEKGQQLPVVVLDGGGEPRTYVLLDGYKRVRALKKLKSDTVEATVWDLSEVDGVLLERLMRTTDSDSALEQGWLLEELNERFGLSHEELARRFDRSQSWVSRRIALVRAVPREVQDGVQHGRLPAHAAMKFLVPMARAKNADCVRLVQSLGSLRPSTRDVEALYVTWASGNEKTRKLVVTQPSLVLKAREQACRDNDQTEDKTPVRKLIDDLGILVGVSRRARRKVAQGLLKEMLPTETQEAQRVAQQARWECEALFRMAKESFAATSGKPHPEQEQDNAR